MAKKNNPFKISRRKWLLSGLGAAGAAAIGCGVDAFLIEPRWLRITHLKLAADAAKRIVHFSDMHYRGDDTYARKITDCINGCSPDFVCFTGDLIDRARHLAGALDHIAAIRSPVYGVAGNHDFWSGASFQQIATCFRATGGAWLVNAALPHTPDGAIKIYGKYHHPAYNEHRRMPRSEPAAQYTAPASSTQKQILLSHFPETVDLLAQEKYDLILAGHSHGGQVCIPLVGPIIVPSGTGRYVRGYYDTPAGPLNVSVGTGTLWKAMRFFCRPEITVIDL